MPAACTLSLHLIVDGVADLDLVDAKW